MRAVLSTLQSLSELFYPCLSEFVVWVEEPSGRFQTLLRTTRDDLRTYSFCPLQVTENAS
jgi:hypothetical protein